MNQQEAIRVLREALSHAESVYRLNVVKDGEPSSTLQNMQAALAATASIQPAAAAEPVAWATFGTKDGKQKLSEPTVASNPRYIEVHKEWKWVPLYTASPAQAATDEVRDRALGALLTRIDDAWANYERMGEVCPFEGQPMIYASTLEEIVELRRALRTPVDDSQPAVGGAA